MGAVQVVVLLVLAQRVPDVGLVPDQRTVKQSPCSVLTLPQRPMIAFHPSTCGMRGPRAPTGVVDSGENVLACSRQRDGLDEVHRQHRLSLRAQELSPRDRADPGD